MGHLAWHWEWEWEKEDKIAKGEGSWWQAARGMGWGNQTTFNEVVGLPADVR